MPPRDPLVTKIEQLRQWRTRPERDFSMGFLKEQFKREVEKPCKQMSAMAELWTRLLPAAMVEHTRLESLSRGVLKVAVDSSGRLYELDRLLRGGLQTQLIKQHKGPAVRRIQLRIASFQEQPDPRRLPREGEA